MFIFQILQCKNAYMNAMQYAQSFLQLILIQKVRGDPGVKIESFYIIQALPQKAGSRKDSYYF